MRTVTRAFIITLCTTQQGLSQAIDWPTARGTHVMAYHDRLRQALLLGGHSSDSALWGWNGERWNVLATGGPAARAHFAMTYDAARDQLVVQGGVAAVFGQDSPTRFGDTWLWDGRRWQRLDATGPGKRDHHAMVWDPVRRQAVLFGGADSSGTQLADTWGWDGRAWRKLASEGPPGRSTHRMVFDTQRGVVVLFGGWGANGLLNDTWEWNGTTWRQVQTATAPSVRFAARMAYDVRRQRTVLFGGRSNSNFSDTWEYDGRTWTKVGVAGPTVRNVHEMVYDQRAGAVLMFGGFNAPANYNDLWTFNGSWRQVSRPDARPAGDRYAQPGPYAVGYRIIRHWDSTRAPTPAADFEGRPVAGAKATPMHISVWYPAQAGGQAIHIGDYYAQSTKRESLEPVSASDVTAAAVAMRDAAPFQLGVELPQRVADSVVMLRAAAQFLAPPADGRFPLVVGGLESPDAAYGLAEYLASHGYVVATSPSLPRTGGQQVTRPAVALETQTRNLEVVHGLTRGLPFVDDTRLALIGLNFDGLAAVNHQMRNMSAAAVVSIDGWELKAQSSASLRASPWFLPARFRVPYLGFSQDNAPTPILAFSDTVYNALRYATRSAYVVHDMEHSQLLSNQLPFPFTTAERRLGYDFIWRTIRVFLDAHVRQDTAARREIALSARERGFPAWLTELERRDQARTPIPTDDEVEQIAMSGDVERLATIIRRARAEDSIVVVAHANTLNLYAFRYLRRDSAKSIAFNALAAEIYPRSTTAANNLGNTYRDAGQMDKAIEWWERALTLIEADPEISAANKPPSRSNIETKIRQARR